MTDIKRIDNRGRMSKAVVFGNIIFLAGQTADDRVADIQAQTRQVLAKIEALLAEAGSSPARMLSATIWLSDIGLFDAMNEVWDAWVDRANPPARATVEAKLAHPDLLIEIGVVAARG